MTRLDFTAGDIVEATTSRGSTIVGEVHSITKDYHASRSYYDSRLDMNVYEVTIAQNDDDSGIDVNTASWTIKRVEASDGR